MFRFLKVQYYNQKKSNPSQQNFFSNVLLSLHVLLIDFFTIQPTIVFSATLFEINFSFTVFYSVD